MEFMLRDRKMDINEGVLAFRKNPNAVLLDVRTAEEFSAGYISGATNIPLQEIECAEEEIHGKNTLVYVYCRSGVRSAKAINALRYMGYTNLVDLGGILDYHGEIVR